MSQKAAFLERQGDHYFERNGAKPAFKSPVIEAIKSIGLPNPKTILEIGCSTGAQLDQMTAAFGAKGFGIEPSQKAVDDGSKLFPALNLQQGTADELPYADAQFDLVVFGGCLYLCDPSDYFKIAYHADRVLAPGGLLVVFDWATDLPYSNPYQHAEGLRAYKMDFASMFRWHPRYRFLSRAYYENTEPYTFQPNDQQAVDLLLKSATAAF